MTCEIITSATSTDRGLVFAVTKPERGWGIRVTGSAAPGERKTFLAHCVLTDAIRRVGRGSGGTEEVLTNMPCHQCGNCINHAIISNTGQPAGI